MHPASSRAGHRARRRAALAGRRRASLNRSGCGSNPKAPEDQVAGESSLAVSSAGAAPRQQPQTDSLTIRNCL